MLTEFSLTHFDFILPLEQKLFELIRNESIIENCEFRSRNESEMSDFSHTDHVIEQLFLIENEWFDPIIVSSHPSASLDDSEVAEHYNHESSWSRKWFVMGRYLFWAGESM